MLDQILNGKYGAFAEANGGFDLITGRLVGRGADAELNWLDHDPEEARAELMAYQRLLRLAGAVSEDDNDAAELAGRMMAAGLHSAHHVADVSEERFLSDRMGTLGLDEDQMRKLHRAATDTKIRTRHLWASFRGTAASPHFRAGRISNMQPEVLALLSELPDYQQFFGSLDYCSCAQCQSIFSPAAYLVDTLRVVYEYIENDTYNPAIPERLKLASRRPDIAQIPLTCEMTHDTVPTIQIINEVLTATIRDIAKTTDVARLMADRPYPFNAPFNLPLARLRLNAETLGRPLWQIYDTLVPQTGGGSADLPSAFDAARERLGLSPQQFSQVAERITRADEICGQYGLRWSKPLTFTAVGTVSVVKDSDTVTGQGTRFESDVRSGDMIKIGGDRRIVKTIVSDTELATTTPWPDAQTNAQMEVYPARDLALSVNFTTQTGLSFDELTDLLDQGLSDAERAAGLADGLFTNAGAAPGKYLTLGTDTTDPDAPISTIANLTMSGLDRLNRFIRLAAHTGLGYEALGWALEALDGVHNGSISTGFVTDLAVIVATAEASGKDVIETLALVSPLKTTGQGDGPVSQALFDRVFNAPSILGVPDGIPAPFLARGDVTLNATRTVVGTGTDFAAQVQPGMRIRIADEIRTVDHVDRVAQNLTVTAPFSASADGQKMQVFPDARIPADALPVYRPDYARNPLFTDPVLLWKVNGTGRRSAAIEGRLSAGLEVSGDDLAALGGLCLRANGLDPDRPLPLNIANLSRLFSYAGTARAAGLRVPAFVKLMDLLGLAEITAPAQLSTLLDTARWIAESKVDPFALEYVIQNETNRFFDPGLTRQGVQDFLAASWAMADQWRVGPETFVNEDITPDISAHYFKQLVSQSPAFLSGKGIATDRVPDFANVAYVNPLDGASFRSPIITAAQSLKAFEQLSEPAHGVLLPGGILAPGFSRETDLDYLFADAPDREAMIAHVQLVLLQVNRRISYVIDTLRTFGATSVSNPLDQGRQVKALCGQLASFLNCDAAPVEAMATFIARQLGMKNFLTTFLRPPKASLPDPVWTYMQVISRAMVAVTQFALSPEMITAIITNPKAYGITDFGKPDLGQLGQIWQLKCLQTAFRDTENALLDYFAMPASGPCGKDTKFALLARLTGWSQSALCLLIDAYDPTEAGYNTVSGLSAMARIFDLSAAIGADIDATLSLAATGTLPVDLSDAVWDSYVSAASNSLALLSSRYSETEWPAALRPLTEQISEAWRDVLVPRAIWELQEPLPTIRTADDLFDYLLIDTKISGCDDISYISQAMQSVQLYMQRARMMLEPAITRVEIPLEWWDWLSSYRVWEANRKVFLYPENFLEPDLRTDKTPLFAEAAQGLSSNEVTESSVTEVYTTYFDGLSTLAGLRHVSSFNGKAPDPFRRGQEADTLFVIGRTRDEPYDYYLQRQIDGVQWTAWEPIDAKIGAPNAVPVYVYGRLFLFWTEQDTTTVAMFSNGGNNNHQSTSASIRYCFVNHAGRWTPPQTLDTMPIAFLPMLDKYSSGKVDPGSFVVQDVAWNTVLPFILTDRRTGETSLLLSYGGNFPVLPNIPPIAPPGSVMADRDAWEIAQRSFRAALYAEYLNTKGANGQLFVNPSILLDRGLNPSPTSALLMPYDADPVANAKMPYVPVIPRSLLAPIDPRTLSMRQTENLFLTYLEGQGQKIAASTPPERVLLYDVSDRSGHTLPTINQPLWYVFNNGDETFLVQTEEPGVQTLSQNSAEVPSVAGNENVTGIMSGAYTDTPQSFDSVKWRFTRLSTGAVERMNLALFGGGIPSLLSVGTQVTPAKPRLPFSRFYAGGTPSPAITPPALPDGDTIDYDGPFGTYFWEVFLFIPWMVADALKANQRFAEAKTWMEYIFDPAVAAGSDPTAQTPADRFWRMVKLRDFDIAKLVDDLGDPAQIKAYNDHPFDPNAIARLRSGAYQKAVVMRYVDILLAWGDAEYTKDTRETINTAMLLYTLARDLLGPRPVDLGPCNTQAPKTFADIQAEYAGKDIPQFLVGLENALGVLRGQASTHTANRYVPYNDLNAYFCAPENERLVRYWDLIEDRLFKIRNCMNIQGVVRKLSLFAPPIDPAAMVGAAARGGGLQLARQWQPTSPPYKFRTVLGLAKELTQQLSAIGSGLLTALEKKDAEDLALIRTAQEGRLLDMTTRVRELQITEIDAALSGLEISRQSAQARHGHYRALLDNGLNVAEIINLESTVLAGIINTQAGLMKGLSAISHLIPNAGSPFAMTYGGREIGASLGAAANVFEAVGTFLQMVATSSGTIASYQRRGEDWALQAQQAAFDSDQIAAQIEASTAMKQSAERQLAIHEATIAQNAEIERFLRGKFTNDELYQWMAGRLSSVFFQTFGLAQEMAMAAELAYQYELNSTESFIRFDYWSGLHRGLLAGEQLMLSLNQMEQSYVDNHVRTLEIDKTISLLALDPRALLDFREKGWAEFTLSEALFARDYPGHYGRQIKTVSVTIPAIVGPYQNIHATLTQLGSQTLVAADKPGVAFLLGENDKVPAADRLRVNWRANQSIALSSGVDDDGLFEMTFADDRYLPFEGTGAVSSWRLSMPKADNLIDFSTITDVIIRLRYTAYDGGRDYAGYVRGLLAGIPYLMRRAFALAQEFPAPWQAFLNPPKGATEQRLDIDMPRTAFPANVTLGHVTRVFARLELAPDVDLQGTLSVTLSIGTGPQAWSKSLVFDNRTDAVLTGLTLGDWVGARWALSTVPADIPKGLKAADGWLDPDRLLSISLIVTCDAASASVSQPGENPSLRLAAAALNPPSAS